MDRVATETRVLLQRLIDRLDLDGGDLERFLGDVMDGRVEPVEVAAVLVALRA
jgi:anthranilate phosphoribosyltransferase